jgi:prephenate dehydrogenase
MQLWSHMAEGGLRDNPAMPDVCIAGLGLIGGSLAMALRRRGWRVSYVDPAVSLEEARRAGAADERLDAPRGSLIVLATPVDAALAQLALLRDSEAAITSTCSVMGALASAAGDLHFVAGHPFAGSERSGIGAATPDLFEGRHWFLARSDAPVERMVSDAGAIPVVLDPAEHDRIMALTSHLPQLLSTALGSMLRDVDPQFIGTGAASMLRLAGSAHDVWRPVIESNRQNLDEAIETLSRLLRDLSDDDFRRANETWDAVDRPNPAKHRK